MRAQRLSKFLFIGLIGILTVSILLQSQYLGDFNLIPSSQLINPFFDSPETQHWFYEHFNTTQFRDEAVTTVDGWGTGTITSSRDFVVDHLDFYESTPYSVQVIDVQGREAVIGCYHDTLSLQSLQVLNLTDLTHLRVLSTENASQFLTAVVLDGDIIYAGGGQNPSQGGSGWLGVYNLSTPGDIQSIPGAAEWLDGGISDLEVQGQYLFAALTNSGNGFGLGIWNIENPANPLRLMNTLSIPNIRGLDIVGELAYLASDVSGFQIINITNPLALGTPIAQLSLPGDATDVLVQGSVAYIAAGPGGVHLIDIAHPTNPRLLSTYDTEGNAHHLALQGKSLMIADGANGLVILDATDSANPLFVTQIPLPYTWNLALYGGDLLVTTQAGVHTYRLGNGLTNLPSIGTYPTGFNIHHIQVEGDTAYLATGEDGLVTVNVSDPTYPAFLDQDIQGLQPFYLRVRVQGHFAYVLNYQKDPNYRGLLIYNVSNPTTIKYLGRIPLQYATDVMVAGELVYIANGPAGVVMCNVTDPRNPTILVSFDVFENATSVAAQGYYLYIADSNSTGGCLYIYSLLDLETPQLVGYQNGLPERTHFDLIVDGNLAYSVNDQAALIWNVTNPQSPTIINTVDASSVGGITTFGPYLFTVNETNITLWNITNLNQPHLLSMHSPGPLITTFTIDGDYTFMATTSGLTVLRHFRSAGTTFETGMVLAQSLQIAQTCDPISWVTLYFEGWVPNGTDIAWEVAPNLSGVWHPVTPATFETLPDAIDVLFWRAFLSSNRDDRSPRITEVRIAYRINFPPEAPVLYYPRPAGENGAFDISWSTGYDREGIKEYRLQMSLSSNFEPIEREWTTTATLQRVTGLNEWTYYFRVQVIDIGNRTSPWSNIRLLTVNLPYPPSTPELYGLQDIDHDGIFTISWNPSTDRDGTIDYYEVQISYFANFQSLLTTWTTQEPNLLITNLMNGTYYIRVRAFDNNEIPSPWSAVQSIQVQIPAPIDPSIPVPMPNLILGLVVVGVIGVSVATAAWLWYQKRSSPG